jgi:hypothetical protein
MDSLKVSPEFRNHYITVPSNSNDYYRGAKLVRKVTIALVLLMERAS